VINQVFNMDCLAGMKNIRDKSVDMILCDLPYGTTDCKWDVVIPFDKLWQEYRRIIKDGGAIVITAREPFTSLLVCSNLDNYRHKWVWNKKQSGSFQNAKYMPLQIEEDIIVFGYGRVKYYPEMRKGQLRKKGGSKMKNECAAGLRPNHFTISDEYYPVNIIELANTRTGTVHPTQKPVALFEYLIKTYTKEGDTVLDSCMGSGTTAIACINTGRYFLGFEKEEKYYDLILDRIEKHSQQLKIAI
jgi:site-specific DNA-methyltransferase (adenine-specific)